MEQALATEQRTGVVLLDTQALRRAGLASILREWAASKQVEIIPATPAEVASAARESSTALAVLNLGGLSLTEETASGWLALLVRTLPDTPIAIVSDISDPDEIVAAFAAGARGFVPTTTEPEVALQAFSFIIRGGSYFPPQALLDGRARAGRGVAGLYFPRRGRRQLGADRLTARQAEVLEHLQAGRSNKMIARFMGTCESTVKVHVRHLMKKLGTANRTQAALLAYAENAVHRGNGEAINGGEAFRNGEAFSLADGAARRVARILLRHHDAPRAS